MVNAASRGPRKRMLGLCGTVPLVHARRIRRISGRLSLGACNHRIIDGRREFGVVVPMATPSPSWCSEWK